jgi:serine/threonine-protein kinase
VPTVRGATLARARALIVAANCSVGRVSRVRSSIVPRGRVITQYPEPGTRLRNGGKVQMEVSSGRR